MDTTDHKNLSPADHQKVHIERAIARARGGVVEHIDELDRRLRSTLDVKSQATEHAPQIVVGGAVVGFLVGFGFPKIFKTILKIGLPLAVAALAAKKVQENQNG